MQTAYQNLSRLSRQPYVWLVAALTIVAYYAELTGIGAAHIGRIPVGWSLPGALWLLHKTATTLQITRRHTLFANAATVGGTTVVVAAALLLPAASVGGATTVGLVAAAAIEEGVFRLAVVLLTLRLLTSVTGNNPDAVRRQVWMAVGTGAVTFTLLPGHLAQVPYTPDGWLMGVWFAMFALLSTWTMFRARLVWFSVLAHAIANITAFSVMTGDIMFSGRAMLMAATYGVVLAVGLLHDYGTPDTSRPKLAAATS